MYISPCIPPLPPTQWVIVTPIQNAPTSKPVYRREQNWFEVYSICCLSYLVLKPAGKGLGASHSAPPPPPLSVAIWEGGRGEHLRDREILDCRPGQNLAVIIVGANTI
jgi:hypothetical protein